VLRFALLALALPSLCQESGAAPEKAMRAWLEQGFASMDRRDFKTAEAALQKGLDLAVSIGSARGEADALRGLGRLQNARGSFPEARKALSRALELNLRESPNPLETARTRNELAYTEWGLGDREAAARLYAEALAGFEAAGARAERADVLFNLAFLSSPAEGRREARIVTALQAAEEVKDEGLAGKIYHLWGDHLYFQGDLRGAVGKLERALALLSAPADRGNRARVFISLGRLYSVHRRPEAALGYYEQALAIHRESGDKQGTAYALAGIVVARQRLGHFAEAARAAQEAIDVARRTGSANLISTALANLAVLREKERDHRSALDLMRESLRLHPDLSGNRQVLLAQAYLGLGEAGEALKAAELALEKSTRLGSLDIMADARYWRARALDAGGRPASAVADIREALALRERLRSQVIPTDYLKRGYAESGASLFDYAIALYSRQGMHEDALATAEQGRARAFFDLLASRSLQDEAQRAATPQPVQAPPDGPGKDEPHLTVLAAVPPLAAASIRRIATAQKSTLRAYWISEDAAFIWLVPPEGPVRAARVPIPSPRLVELVREASGAPSGNVTPAPERLAGLKTRGRGVVAVRDASSALRELHRLLIEPVADRLPAGGGARLTIVPHGPLHRLSFAALKDAKGRYLLEDYVLNYVSAVSLMERTGPAAPEPSYLVISDPRDLPPGPDGRRLPALPGARRESQSLAAILNRASLTLLGGLEASEPAVRKQLPAHRVIHFATHGVLIDDRPFDSFLALGGVSGDGTTDGRLTAREIYDLRMRADLVVLSACRTADGPLTGDGIVGLARAFFYAGANSLLATLWDVADEPTQRLMTAFYRHYARDRSKSEALRAAQLELLAALRRGRFAVATPLGRMTLDEHPVFWAGFVILGQP
jgi:CHAT domain-containing protein